MIRIEDPREELHVEDAEVMSVWNRRTKARHYFKGGHEVVVGPDEAKSFKEIVRELDAQITESVKPIPWRELRFFSQGSNASGMGYECLDLCDGGASHSVDKEHMMCTRCGRKLAATNLPRAAVLDW